MNVFERIFSKFNIYFWVSLLFVCMFQFVSVHFFSFLIRTVPLNRSEWGACIVTGALVIPVAAMLKLTGPRLLRSIPFTKFIDEDKFVNDGLVNKITQLSNTQIDIKADAFRGKKKQEGYNALDADTDDNYQRENNV